uniref:Uncharacterized protein n=1 Tax=Kalanchoe fedtschenkoi TaxID=63787 RepID=A0A7N0TRY1_KALFE
MTDNDLGDRTNNVNEWDVVSLTASTYAAAPSYGGHEFTTDAAGSPVFGGETPRTMFLSDHFVFPPSQHENLPLEPDIVEDVGVETAEEETEDVSVSGEYDELNQLDTPDELRGRMFGVTIVEEDEVDQSKVVEVSGQDTSVSPDLLNSKMVKDDKLKAEIPSSTWWKRHATSIYSNAKESNLFWSIFVAAAVMGLVIIGQRWQQERWQVLQMKLHLNLNDEKMARLLGPLTRLKDAVMGSHHRIPFLPRSASV